MVLEPLVLYELAKPGGKLMMKRDKESKTYINWFRMRLRMRLRIRLRMRLRMRMRIRLRMRLRMRLRLRMRI